MYDFISLIIPFVALVLYAHMIDKLIQVLGDIMLRTHCLPEKIEASLAYVVILILAYLNCWQADWKFFSYLDINYMYDWESYLASALLISGGSVFVKEGFSIINVIPMSLQGISSAVRGVVAGGSTVVNAHSNNQQTTSCDNNTPTI